jgi:hypothetical protein
MNDRRRSRRRSLPFVRSAVLEVNGRNHIVAVADLSPEAAFLSTRVAVKPQDTLRLKMVIPRDGREVPIPCRLVRNREGLDQKVGQRDGIVVRFHGLDASTIRRVEEFSMEGFLPKSEPVPAEHFEYQVLDRERVDTDELNRLGRDGWSLTTALPTEKGVRLILLRRL